MIPLLDSPNCIKSFENFSILIWTHRSYSRYSSSMIVRFLIDDVWCWASSEATSITLFTWSLVIFSLFQSSLISTCSDVISLTTWLFLRTRSSRKSMAYWFDSSSSSLDSISKPSKRKDIYSLINFNQFVSFKYLIYIVF